MEPSVESLFQQIKQSEIEAQNRKTYMNEIKQSIYTAQEKLKAAEKEYAEVKQDLKEKVLELGQHESQVKVVNIQVDVYRQEKKEMDEKLHKLLLQKEELAEKLRCQQTSQCSELDNFAIPGWTDKGREIYMKKQQDKLKEVTEEEKRLKIIVQHYEEYVELLAHKEKLQQEYEQSQKEINEIEGSLMEETKMTAEMTKQQHLTQARLDEELNSIQSDVLREKQRAFDLREKCCDLQKELQSLQQKNWQRNLHRRNEQNSHIGFNNDRARNEYQTQAESTMKGDDLDPEFSDNEDFSEICETVEENILNTDQAQTTEVPTSSTTHRKIFRSKKC